MTKEKAERFIYKDANILFDVKKNYFFDNFILNCEANGISSIPLSLNDIKKSFVSNNILDIFLLDSNFFDFDFYCSVYVENNSQLDNVFLFFVIEDFEIDFNYCITITFLEDKFVSFQIFSLNCPSGKIKQLWLQ